MAQIPVALNAGHLAARLEAQADNPDGAVAAPAPVLPAVNPEHAVQAEQVQQAQQPPQVCSQFCADSCSCWRFSHMLPVQLCRMSGLCLFSVVFLPVSSFFFSYVCSNFYWVCPFSLPTTRAVFQRTCVCVFPYILFSLSSFA